MSCSTFSSLASNTRSSAYFIVWMICPPILKSPNPSRASLVRHLLYKLKRIGDKQHPCLTPLPIFTLLVSPWFSSTLTLWATYKLLISLPSCQSKPFPFRICSNLVQLTQSNAFWQSSGENTVAKISDRFKSLNFVTLCLWHTDVRKIWVSQVMLLKMQIFWDVMLSLGK